MVRRVVWRIHMLFRLHSIIFFYLLGIFFILHILFFFFLLSSSQLLLVLSGVMFPTIGKLREGGRLGALERVSGFVVEKLTLVPDLIGTNFVRVKV